MIPEAQKFSELPRARKGVKSAFGAHLRDCAGLLIAWKAQLLPGECPEIALGDATVERLGTALSIFENQCEAKVTLTEAAGVRVLLDTITAEMIAGHKDLKVPFDAFVRSGAELLHAWQGNLTAEQHVKLGVFAANNFRLGIAVSMPADEWIAEVVAIDSTDSARIIHTIKLNVERSKLN